MKMGGYMRSLLYVDLTSRKVTVEPLDGSEDVLRKYIGGYGLGLKLLTERLPTGIISTSPENIFLLMTGPLTGVVSVPCANNATITALNGETDFTPARSHSHGRFAPLLKFAGYDGLMLEGQSEEPVILSINNDKVEFLKAEKIWGLDTHETEDAVKSLIGNKKASVATIGPAGENLVRGSIVENDYNHSFSHSGVGRVLGSKRVKAIAVYGTRKAPAGNKERLTQITTKWHRYLRELSPTSMFVKDAGIPKSNYVGLHQLEIIAVNNFLEKDLPEYGRGVTDHDITPRACWGCPVDCSFDVTLRSGPYAGYTATLTGGGQNTEGAGTVLGISETSAVFYLTDLCDRLGLESGSAGSAAAVAFEAFEKGLITKEDTDGLELKWGSHEAAAKLYHKIAKREGFGDILADGPKFAAERLGLPEAGVHVKGAAINLHDWRTHWGALFGQIVGTGVSWPAPGIDCWGAEPDLGYPEMSNPLKAKGKAEEARKTYLRKLCFADCMGLCSRATWTCPDGMELCSAALSAVTGWDFSPEEGLQIADRVLSLERILCLRHGLTAADDLEVSERLVEAPPSGAAKGKSIKPYLEGLVRDYYRLNGWDERYGKPLRSTLRKLGLESYEDEIWGCARK